MRRHPSLMALTFGFLWFVSADVLAQTVAEEVEAPPEEAATSTGGEDVEGETDIDGEGSSPEPAVQGQPVDNTTERARAHDAQAQELFSRGDFAGALAEQRRAQSLMPATPRVFNMAICEERLGNFQAALDLYWDFVSSQDAPNERRRQARQSIERLTEQIATARAAAETAAEAEAVAEAQTSTPASSRDHSISLAPVAFWASLGLTVACSVTTITLGAVTLVRHEEFLGLYRDDNRSSQLQEQGQNLALATNIMLGVTLFSALTTLVFGLDTDWNRRNHHESVAIVPSPSPTGGSLMVAGRF